MARSGESLVEVFVGTGEVKATEGYLTLPKQSVVD